MIETITQLYEKGVKFRKHAEELLMVLQERSLIEQFYAKDLERLALKLPSSDFPQVTEFLKQITQQVSLQSQKFSQQIAGEIIETFKNLLSTQAAGIKEPYLEGLKNEKRKSRLGKKLEETKQKYWQCCEECEQVAVALDEEPAVSKKKKLVQKLLLNKTHLDAVYKSYLEAVDRHSKYKKTYLTKLKKITALFTLQETELVQAYSQLQKDFLKCQCISKQSDYSTYPNISEIFVSEENISKLLEYPESYFESYEGTHPLFLNLGINSAPHLHASILEVSGGDSGTHTAVEEMYRTEIGNIINKAWTGNDLTSEEYLHFNGMLKEHLGRKAWSWCVNLKRTQGSFEISEKGFVLVGELMVATLNECERTQDVIIAKNCIILSQTFYRKPTGCKEYLQNFIISHTLWENIEFWHKLITSAIVEELKNQGESECVSDHLKSLVFCQLVSFGHIMMSFKMSKEVIMETIELIGSNYKLNKQEAEEVMVIST